MTAVSALGLQHLSPQNAADICEMFRLLGYTLSDPHPFEGAELDVFEFDPPEAAVVQRAHLVAEQDRHAVYLFEVSDLRLPRLRGLAWSVLQRGGSALIVLTRDYRELLFVDPRTAGSAIKSNVRVNKLKLVTGDPTRHDLDTLNAIHAYKRTGQQISDAQAEAFNVARLTRKFFDEYHEHFQIVCRKAQEYNRGIREFQDADQKDKLHAFAQRLLGRIMFITFLQRKGWLGPRGRFLTEQYYACMRRHSGDEDDNLETFFYYDDVLTPLFFETMNQRRPGNITRWPGIQIPYLNGGLFDPARDPQGPILLPDSLFDPNSSDGLLAFFNRYNFTVSEDTPLEQDVAVDPEMLGKVFENLLEAEDRGQSGSFYTPRGIVAYMCQEALAGYLEDSAAIPRDRTRALFDPDSVETLAADEAARVGKALDTLTVLDPAVGSGSFLIGMLNEIIRLRRACPGALGVAITHGRVADWKEAIIRDTLYGVDIKPEAIEVAQLRLWLALVVNQTLEQARPLPNLDYKLMAGNSLIETIDGDPVLSPAAEGLIDGSSDDAAAAVQQNFLGEPVQSKMALFDEEQAVQRECVKLDELRRRFFQANPDERKALRKEISLQERQIVYASLHEKSDKLMLQITEMGRKAGQQILTRAEDNRLKALSARLARVTALEQDLRNPDKPLPFFLYRMHFHEVFAAKGGFDIVIANPPYVRMELITHLKAELEPAYLEVYAGTADLYVYFYARGLELARPSGMLVYITPNKFLRSSYGKRLRRWLSMSGQITLEALIDFGDLPLFDAITYSLIVALRKADPPANHALRALTVDSLEAAEALPVTVRHAFPLPQSALTETEWQLSDPVLRILMDKLRAAGKPLGEYVNGKFYRGVVTGLNEAFVIGEAKRAQLIAADPNCAAIIKPFLRGRDVKRWQITPPGLYLIYLPWDFQIDEYPSVHAHLENCRGKLATRPEVKAGRVPWYALSRYGSEYVGEFEKPKIVYPDIAPSPQFAFDTDHHFLGDTTFTIPANDIFLLGVLNSNCADFFYRRIASQIRGGYIRYKSYYVFNIPIPDVEADLQNRIAALGGQCLAAAASDRPERLPALEAELNALVYQAYGLTDDEVRVIEAAVGGKTAGVESGERSQTGEEE